MAYYAKEVKSSASKSGSSKSGGSKSSGSVKTWVDSQGVERVSGTNMAVSKSSGGSSSGSATRKTEERTSSTYTNVGNSSGKSSGGSSSSKSGGTTLLGSGYTYDKNTDYAAKMQEAAAKGDYQAAARYEQQRNAKIIGEGLDQRGLTNNYNKYTEAGKNANYGYGYGWGMGNRVTEVTDKQGNKTYTSATRLDDPLLKNSGIDFNNIGSTFTFATPGGIDENYNKTVTAGDVWYGDYDSLSGAEQRALQNARNYGQFILKETGINPYTGERETESGALDAYLNALTGGTTQGRGTLSVSPRPLTGNKTVNLGSGGANPYYSALPQAEQEALAYLERLNDNYDRQASNIVSAIDAYLKQGTDRLNSQKTDIREQGEEAGRQAYIAYMMQQKSLPALLAAQGIRGGGTESAYLDLMTAYQGQKGDIYQGQQAALRDVDNAVLDLTNQAEVERLNQLIANNNAALSAYQNAWEGNRQYLSGLYNNAVGFDQWQAELL